VTLAEHAEAAGEAHASAQATFDLHAPFPSSTDSLKLQEDVMSPKPSLIDILMQYSADAEELRATVKEALDQGADIHQQDAAGCTPLMLLSVQGHASHLVAPLIFQYGPNLEQTDWHGKNGLMLAAKHGKSGMVRFLLSKGVLLKSERRLWTYSSSSRRYGTVSNAKATFLC
jgi:ankyrin repeat protein